MTTTITFTRSRSADRDVECFQILRYRDREDPKGIVTEYLGPDGEWHVYGARDLLRPFCVIDGQEIHRVFGTGLRSQNWTKSWDVPETETTDGD